MNRDLAVAVAACGVTRVTGEFERHVSPTVRELSGSSSGGRWGAEDAYSVLYLGKPRESVVVEAYRHLVDVTEGMTGDLVGPRRVLRARVDVDQVLDLRIAKNRETVGLDERDLMSDPGDYRRCQSVGRAAYQLGLSGVIAPAATSLGETLALFEIHLAASALPVLIGEEDWPHLPPDPRVLRAV